MFQLGRPWEVGEHGVTRQGSQERILQVAALMILVAGFTVPLVALVTVLVTGNTCLGVWRITPACRSLLAQLQEPSRLNMEVAALAAVAVLGASITASHPSLPRPWLDALLIAGILSGIGVALDSSLRGTAPVLGMALLFFLIALTMRHAVQSMAIVACGRDPDVVKETRRLLASTLVLLPAGTVALAGCLALYANWRQLTALHKAPFLWDAVIVTLDALALLLSLCWAENRALWNGAGVRVDRGVAGRTLGLGGVLIAAAIFIAFVMPVRAIVAILLEPVGLFGRIPVGPLSHIAAPDAQPPKPRDGSGEDHDTRVYAVADGHHHPHKHPGATHVIAHHTDWLLWSAHLLLWAVVLAALGLLLYRWRQAVREGREAELPGAVRFLLKLWRRLRGTSRTLAREVGWRLPAGLADCDRGLFRGLRGTASRSPREQIQRYYLDVLAEAGRHGVPRPPARTPSQFEGQLEPRLPGSGTALRDLTGLFLRARYAPFPIAAEDASAGRQSWRTLRTALRRISHSSDGRSGP